jgi:hypothetical protein
MTIKLYRVSHTYMWLKCRHLTGTNSYLISFKENFIEFMFKINFVFYLSIAIQLNRFYINDR